MQVDLYLKAEEIIESCDSNSITSFRNSLTTPYDIALYDLMCSNPKFPTNGRGFKYTSDPYGLGIIQLIYPYGDVTVGITANDKEGTASLTDPQGNNTPLTNSPLVNSLADYFNFQLGCLYL